MASASRCPFCDPPRDRIVRESEYGLVLSDAYPLSPGHRLVIPRRHVASFFDLDPLEQADLLNLLVATRRDLADGDRQPDGYNVGLNDGEAAGQTVDHCHWHVVPRYQGDVPDPRGGIRWVIPEKAPYWSMKT